MENEERIITIESNVSITPDERGFETISSIKEVVDYVFDELQKLVGDGRS